MRSGLRLRSDRGLSRRCCRCPIEPEKRCWQSYRLASVSLCDLAYTLHDLDSSISPTENVIGPACVIRDHQWHGPRDTKAARLTRPIPFGRIVATSLNGAAAGIEPPFEYSDEHTYAYKTCHDLYVDSS